jgi:hypothetical protein
MSLSARLRFGLRDGAPPDVVRHESLVAAVGIQSLSCMGISGSSDEPQALYTQSLGELVVEGKI